MGGGGPEGGTEQILTTAKGRDFIIELCVTVSFWVSRYCMMQTVKEYWKKNHVDSPFIEFGSIPSCQL